jgi:signal transduction histidine kinase
MDMDGDAAETDPPRPPFFGRISPQRWVEIDVVLAVVLFFGSLGHLFRGLIVGSEVNPSWWALVPLYALATIPIAFRRRWPEWSLVCIAGSVATATMLGYSLAPAPFIAFPLYSVTVKQSRRQSLLVLIAVEGLLVLALAVASVYHPLKGDVTFNFILPIAVWFVGDSVRTRRAYQSGLIRQAAEEQKRQLDRAQQAVVEERLEIARELHDVIAHSLSVIAIQSGVGRHLIDSRPEEGRKALDAVEYISRSALDELRRVLRVLRRNAGQPPELAPAPALSELDDLVSRVRAAGVPVELRTAGDLEAIPSGLSQSVYRIVQEALTNVVRHTHGAKTTVSIEAVPKCLHLEVVNAANASVRAPSGQTDSNGNGRPTGGEHHGIIGMNERALAFGGSLVATPLPDGGFRVAAQFPLRREQ